jgi:hypothetical protein
MELSLPRLETGRVYHRNEVDPYISYQTGASNFDIVYLQFPRFLETWDSDLWQCRNGEEMLLQYQLFDMDGLEQAIKKLEAIFDSHEEHRRRVENIGQVLSTGAPVFPAFMQQNDPQYRIIEGMRRAVALLRLGSRTLPTFLMGYSDWFDGIKSD